MKFKKLLFFGIGNVGRQDDGLGIRLIEKLEANFETHEVEFECNYQLNIEDALRISEFETVIFVDATKELNTLSPFAIRPLHATHEVAFSTHAMSLSSVLGLCEELYQKKPQAFLITIPGYSWEIADQLSEQASENLEQTFQIVSQWLKQSLNLRTKSSLDPMKNQNYA